MYILIAYIRCQGHPHKKLWHSFYEIDYGIENNFKAPLQLVYDWHDYVDQLIASRSSPEYDKKFNKLLC